MPEEAINIANILLRFSAAAYVIRSFKLSDVFETILTSESYMKDDGWFINSIRFCTNKNEWFSLNSEDIDKLKDINNLRKEVLYITYLVIEFKFKS